MKKIVFLFCCLIGGLASLAMAVEFPPTPTPFRYLNDYTRTLSSQQQNKLEQKLIKFQQETGSQIAVVLIPTTGEYTPAEYAFKLGDQWGIGRKKLNDGVLMLIAKNDRKIFIATGEGLEGAMPDAFLSQLIRNVITPQFKQGNYAQGINNGLDYLIAASKGEYKPDTSEKYADYIVPALMLFFFITIVVIGELNWRRGYISQGRNSRISGNDFFRHHQQREYDRFRGFGHNDHHSGGGFGGGSFGGGGAGGSW